MIHAVAIHNYSAVGVLKYMPCMVTIRYTIRKFHMMCTVRLCIATALNHNTGIPPKMMQTPATTL